MEFKADLIDMPFLGRIALIATAKDEIGAAAFRRIVEPVGVNVMTTRTVYTDDEPDEQG